MSVPFAREFGSARYLSLTTFRRDGTAVATPVWVVEAGGLLYVWTGARTGKARRVRREPRVTVEVCDFRGRTDEVADGAEGAVVEASARILPREDRPDVWNLMRRKYGWQLRGTLLSGRWNAAVRRRRTEPGTDQVFIELRARDGASAETAPSD